MKFYFTPGSCSTGIHILLEEIGLVFEAYLIDLLKGDQFRPEYLAINPRASVPTLVLPDGTVLTDFVSIALWLAENHPRSNLLPVRAEAQVAVLDLMNYVINTIHGQGFTRIFTTERYATDENEVASVKEQGRKIVQRGLEIIDNRLDDGVLSSGLFTIADAALFYVEFWADRIEMALPDSCEKHYARLLQRHAVRQVLMEEGYHSTLNRQARAKQRTEDATA